MPLYTIALYQGERCAWQGSELAFPDDEEAVYRALSEYDWLCLDEDDPTPQEWRIEVWDGRNDPIQYQCCEHPCATLQ